MAELFYENKKIKISRSVFITGQGKSFAVPNIKHIRDEHKTKPLFPLIAGVILGIVGTFFGELFENSETILGGLGALLTLYYFTDKDRYTIYLTLQTREEEAFKTKKEALFREVLENLRRAVEAKKP